MKAFELRSYSGPSGLTLADVPAPTPGADELLIKVEAVGVNFPDLLLTKGQYQLKPELPAVVGCEVAGTVISAPPGVGWSTGDKVCAFIWRGAHAEKALVPIASAVHVPPEVTSVQAAAMIVNYQTVMFALERRARLRAGERVLVLGAGGGIGTAAIQVAKGMGAHVTGGVADEEQRATALRAGADDAIILRDGFAAEVRELGGRGVDVVVDPLGDWLFDEAVRTLDPEGRVVVLGFAAGRIPTVALNRLLLKNIGVIGAAYGAFADLEPSLTAHQAARIFDMFARGHVRPELHRVDRFEALPDLLDELDRGAIRGKAVVTVE